MKRIHFGLSEKAKRTFSLKGDKTAKAGDRMTGIHCQSLCLMVRGCRYWDLQTTTQTCKIFRYDVPKVDIAIARKNRVAGRPTCQ